MANEGLQEPSLPSKELTLLSPQIGGLGRNNHFLLKKKSILPSIPLLAIELLNKSTKTLLSSSIKLPNKGVAYMYSYHSLLFYFIQLLTITYHPKLIFQTDTKICR